MIHLSPKCDTDSLPAEFENKVITSRFDFSLARGGGMW